MSYINVGAINVATGQRFKTKKALKEAVRDDPSIVKFDKTALFDGDGEIYCDEIPAGAKLSVVGPDPYTARNWYATVEKTGDKIKVA